MPVPIPFEHVLVTTTVAEQDLTDNLATVTTPVGAPSTDVAISKTGPASVTTGASFTYRIVVGSSGPSDAAAVTVSDPTPAGLTFVGNAGDCTTPFPCALGTIPAGADPHDPRDVRSPAAYSGPSSIVNTVTVATAASDPDPGNNAST